MIFEKDNDIDYFQDMCFGKGIPHGIDFKVKVVDFGSNPDLATCSFSLTAHGYGLSDGNGGYGNGCLLIRLRLRVWLTAAAPT